MFWNAGTGWFGRGFAERLVGSGRYSVVFGSRSPGASKGFKLPGHLLSQQAAVDAARGGGTHNGDGRVSKRRNGLCTFLTQPVVLNPSLLKLAFLGLHPFKV